MIDKFENAIMLNSTAMEFGSKGIYHGHAKKVDLKCKRHASVLVNEIEEMGKPFAKDSSSLLKLDLRETQQQTKLLWMMFRLQ